LTLDFTRITEGKGGVLGQRKTGGSPRSSERLNMPIQEVLRIEPAELKQRFDRSDPLLIVDVRKPLAFEEHHIRGAISVPVNDINTRYKELPSDRTIVCY
jgi:3-mercaptopyruvate sulfurtransferase SseA